MRTDILMTVGKLANALFHFCSCDVGFFVNTKCKPGKLSTSQWYNYKSWFAELWAQLVKYSSEAISESCTNNQLHTHTCTEPKERHLLSNVVFLVTLPHLSVFCVYRFLNKHLALAEIAPYTVFRHVVHHTWEDKMQCEMLYVTDLLQHTVYTLNGLVSQCIIL